MKYEKQLQAQELRKLGKSIKTIAKELNVSPSSVQIWTQNIVLTDNQIDQLKHSRRGGSIQAARVRYNTHKNIRQQYQEEGRIEAQKQNLLHCMGSMLFWAEGSKKKNQITFTNSDVNMIKLFVRFLVEALNIKAEDLSIRINCFLNNMKDIKQVHDYWISELNIHGCTINKPTIKLTCNTIDNFGICCVNVYDTQKAQQLYGAIQEYAGFSNELCLHDKRTRKQN